MTRSSPSPPDPGPALLREIAAAPRPTGSSAIDTARARVTRALRDAGFTVRELPFEFSGLPGRYATPLFGAAALCVAATAGHLGASGSRIAPLLVAAFGAGALAAAARWVARHGTTRLPFLRERGVQLEATRGDASPRVWLCAHLDTKSQPVPTLVRAFGVGLVAAGFAATLVLAAAGAFGQAAGRAAWAAATLVTLAGAIPVMLSVVGTRSPGALDNASGVAAVVAAVQALGNARVGVLITDAEELGLAGARAWALETRPAGTIVLNCDGVDDAGENVVMYTGRRPDALLAGIAAASRAAGIACRPRRMPLGLLTDSVAFSDAGIPSVTFARGRTASLARVHSARDDLTHLRGTGIAPVATLLARSAAYLANPGASWPS